MKKMILLLLVLCSIQQLNAQKFEVSYSPELMSDSFSGSVLLYLSKENPSPKDGFHIFERSPMFRVVVEDLQPGATLTFDDAALAYPVALSNIERGEYYVQALFDRKLKGQTINNGPGNLYSDPARFILDKNFDTVYTILCNQMVPEVTMKETDRMKELVVDSRLLSQFHDRPMQIAGAVQLPEGYDPKSKKKYPVVYSVFGFGANYKTHAGYPKYDIPMLGEEPAIVVYLDGRCLEGHSTYANSDINGPWGDALVKEFIPALEKKYQANGARFLFGHSSGGWTVMWLQTQYPETFAGAWSSAPDQVDFRNWQNINIYETKNLYYSPSGQPLSDVTIAGRIPVTSTKDMFRMEEILYRGEQMRSFDAVFGHRDEKGEIIRLVDLETGDINPEALPYFRRYDLSYQLRNNWDQYEKAIAGKILISVGEHDNFYLHKAVHLLDEEMQKLNADMQFAYYPGDHFTVFTEEYKQAGVAFLTECYAKWKEE
ncbi:alpha/beta hydrolase-fold protein [Reichenbachiella ulvae]|uniref:Alpha/beta hydrolase-fold protein n=1 Tax=Reichenbachiella ulvae TaxID=2980104 RepID=A0ABT3CP96_9BACT|nr:prolyl oligopeptidase family serine peptidase [Reichenbachiella ulvae]MCV9385454.1 alpha/beta hydrolase-fold protein [Reichenbachiella ulvae]